MENCSDEIVRSASSTTTPTIHPFTFKKRLCVFCAVTLDFQSEQVDINWESLNEYTFINGVSILCETLNVKENLNRLFGDGGRMDNWRLPGINNFVQCTCCERCYELISELVSLQQLIVKSQISLKENARKLENFVVVSSQAHHQKTDDFEAPLEYSVTACGLLRQEILNNFSKKDQSSKGPPPKNELSRKPKSFSCPKQAVVRLERLDVSLLIKQDDRIPSPINEISDNEFTCPFPHSPEAMETDEDAVDEKNDHEYTPIRRERRRLAGRKRGRPKKIKPSKNPDKPALPRNVKQDPPLSSSNVTTTKRKRLSQTDMDADEIASSPEKPTTTASTKRARPLIIGSRHCGTGPKVHPIYFLSTSPSSTDNNMESYLMMYNVKFSKTSTSLRCLHPDCTHQEPLTGYFTDQIILRNMRFHIRFAHRSLPKKDNPDKEKNSFYYCYPCDKQIDIKLGFLEHCRQLHAEEDQLPPFCFCEVCGDPNVATGDFTQHVFSHKSKLEKAANLKKGIGKVKDILKPLIHPCDQCDKCFKCHTELMTHRKTHVPFESRLNFVCEICGKGCLNAWAVEHHKRRVHLKDLPVVFKCHVCGRGFMQCQKKRWEEHLNMHTGELPYQCEQCGKRFIGKWHLTKHVRAMHAGEKGGVTCEFCGKIYKTEDYLRKHCLKKHPDKVKIKMGLSGEEDKDKYKPLEKREGFIGPKLMFPCEPCEKVFIFKSMLITHLKNRHKMFYERKEDYPQQMTL